MPGHQKPSVASKALAKQFTRPDRAGGRGGRQEGRRTVEQSPAAGRAGAAGLL